MVFLWTGGCGGAGWPSGAACGPGVCCLFVVRLPGLWAGGGGAPAGMATGGARMVRSRRDLAFGRAILVRSRAFPPVKGRAALP